ncbi:NAD(P)-dependent dehydrogenase (short-subunit alcohol dehydrogenase family) [Paenochrobactrum gallinarii]|uniref:NAD(P)-dependent dehydrogenase (Short-subunit alcohol dehydrogenase family) n=1 Tax=Paenochrobactrum gallinarii TaxID=643673 RepID=A0A841LQ56_9HYPH|nr:NAD(P)-dependent dehydrogenase (short-subunit alcohol dehydrogenase family) [Paenochrobactrum gallinarii]
MLSRFQSDDSHNPPVLVTGGARRIGKAIIEDMAAHNFPVIIHCNDSVTDAKSLKQEIISRGGQAEIVKADLTSMPDVRTLIKKASEPFGAIGILINNASLFENDQIGHLDEALWDRHFMVHVKAPVFLAESMAQALPADQTGMIVNMIDQRVLKLNPQFYSYTLSKSALWTATRTLAQSLAPRIRVNAVSPGPTLPSERQDPRDFNEQVAKVLLQRAPDLDEFGQAIRTLWDLKSVTGQMLCLDGGQHLAWETPDIAGINE